MTPEPTPEMIEEAVRSYLDALGDPSNGWVNVEAMRAALSAALAVAPTVDGIVWCEQTGLTERASGVRHERPTD